MKEIFLHDLRDSIFGGKFAIAFALMLLAFLVSLGMMSSEYTVRMENHNESFSMPGKDLFWDKVFFWVEEDNSWSSDTLTYPMGVVKAPEPLLFFSRGMDKQMRQSVEFFTTFPIVDITIKPEQEVNLVKLIFTAPDLLFVMKVLVSLLAILFSFNLISAERERGTLKLLLSYGASRAAIFSGKFLGGLVAIWIAFTAAFLVYVLALTILTPVELAGEVPARIALIYLTSLLHIAIFFGLGAAMSVFFRRSAPSLIFSLFVWLLLVFALPGLSSLLAQQFAPIDSDEKVARTKLEKAQQMEANYAETHPEDTNVSGTAGYGQRHDAIRDQVTAELMKIEDEHQRRRSLQATVTTGLARISPIGSLTYLYSALSRNGLEDYRLYHDDLVLIRERMNKDVTEALQSPEFGRLYMEGGFNIPRELKEMAWDLFDIGHKQGFRQLTLQETLSGAWFDFLLLGLFAVVPAAVTFTRFLSYDPR